MSGERREPRAASRTGGGRRRRTAPKAKDRPSLGAALRAQGAYLVVAGGVLLGLATAWQNFRAGAYVMAAALLLGAALRLTLPSDRLGFLVTRKKPTDVLTLVALGTGLAILAFLAPRAAT
ncbi:DUF3017 domain-containing protein [Actinocorallia sp. API 0066]|uniref:DUF3017 domain-containing protein n=1 Tax=Actinocorallia sp. API 0066 TaxID=2896846 RepID=UPI001E46160B|nr:DUF3017 domain-containing protein [Actinocorallia sp. API 0066]MCD0453156.1 DUF3017 domain-containing protein [Actinocorallia sp. API 0066]